MSRPHPSVQMCDVSRPLMHLQLPGGKTVSTVRKVHGRETGEVKRIQVIDPALVAEYVRQWEAVKKSCDVFRATFPMGQWGGDILVRQLHVDATVMITAAEYALHYSRKLENPEVDDVLDFVHLLNLDLKEGDGLKATMVSYNAYLRDLPTYLSHEGIRPLPLDIEGILRSTRSLLSFLKTRYAGFLDMQLPGWGAVPTYLQLQGRGVVPTYLQLQGRGVVPTYLQLPCRGAGPMYLQLLGGKTVNMVHMVGDREMGKKRNIPVIDPALVAEHIKQWKAVEDSCKLFLKSYPSAKGDSSILQLRIDSTFLNHAANVAIDFSQTLTEKDFQRQLYFNYWLEFGVQGRWKIAMESYNKNIKELPDSSFKDGIRPSPLDIEGVLQSMKKLLKALKERYEGFLDPNEPLQPRLQ